MRVAETYARCGSGEVPDVDEYRSGKLHRAFMSGSQQSAMRVWGWSTPTWWASCRAVRLTPRPLWTHATLVETRKQEALYSYKKYRAYQPLITLLVRGRVDRAFGRDGNCTAGHQQLRVLIEALGRLPGRSSEVGYGPAGVAAVLRPSGSG